MLPKPAVRRSIVLPELADLLDLPAADRFARLLVLGVGSEPMPDGPTSNRRAIELELVAAMDFGGGKTIGSRRACREELAQQGEDLRGPGGAAIASGAAWFPRTLPALGTSAKVVGIKHVEAAAAQLQFGLGLLGRDALTAEALQDVTNKGRRVSALELLVVFSSGGG